MKNKLLLGLLALICFLSPPSEVQAQVSGYSCFTNQLNSGASTIYSRDTLSGLDTIIVYLNTNASQLFTVDAIIRCDSISGATAGTAALQYASDNNTRLTNSQVMWYTVTSATLDGAGRTQYRLTGTQTSRRARLFITTPNSTARKMMITYVAALKRTQ